MRVSIVEHRPEWQSMFAEERKSLQSQLADADIQVEHVGSTAVAGLAAKPIIDIMVGLPDFSSADTLVPMIQGLAYEYIQKYETVMPFRRFFIKDQAGVRTHQIHMVGIGTEFWDRILLFRDYLRQNPSVAAEYASFKKQLAEREWSDINDYADAKTQFITEIENKARTAVEANQR